ncbi:OsmC family protein [Myroides indicus]|uniref:Putative OsmC-like protein n=1 Tax=Myroides indicus TaxID=1323422 RepID=A0A4R7F3Q8_9FLAO|nr:OsmC family protein [Myroides indicus]TDS65066.1 putative OsmC-like protein [Myroides indicus]
MLSKIVYQGDLRTESVHIQSGEKIITDAPVDNHGKGQAFSPTDMVTNAAAACAMTIMAIKAAELNIDLKNSTAQVYKEMQSDPRRIKKITIHFEMRGASDQKQKTVLERAAMHCPVFLSLHPEVEKEITFKWL